MQVYWLTPKGFFCRAAVTMSILSATERSDYRSAGPPIRVERQWMNCCFKTLSISASRSSRFAMECKRLNVWLNGSLIQDLDTAAQGTGEP